MTTENPHISANPMVKNSVNLSVNLNKVALVRNTRHLGIPSLTRAASQCLQAGAAGITVHPRPDARHIRASDVIDLATLLQDWPQREFNIEGNPFHNLMDCVADLPRPPIAGTPGHFCARQPRPVHQ